MINAFVCNFRLSANGTVNDDILESNFLNQRLYERLSVRTIHDSDSINDKPLIINRTKFKQSAYKDTLRSLKQRMKVKQGSEDMIALSNVSMFVHSFAMSCRKPSDQLCYIRNPFPTAGDFLTGMMQQFREVAEQEITVRSPV